jgi:hypothetical protein
MAEVAGDFLLELTGMLRVICRFKLLKLQL